MQQNEIVISICERSKISASLANVRSGIKNIRRYMKYGDQLPLDQYQTDYKAMVKLCEIEIEECKNQLSEIEPLILKYRELYFYKHHQLKYTISNLLRKLPVFN